MEQFRAIVRHELQQAGIGVPSAFVEEILSIKQASALLNLTVHTIYALVSKRSIPHSKRGNKLYFNRTELLAWVASGNREVDQQKGGGRG